MSAAALFPIILAGGRGARFWPLSRRVRPKPFLSWTDGGSLLQQCWIRARGLAPVERIHLALEPRLAEAARLALPDLGRGNLILEPEARDTGPAAVHAAWWVEERHPGAMLALLPADHLIADDRSFREAMATAVATAERQDALVCLGILPSDPATGFGYLECDEPMPAGAAAARVKRFVEKPTSEAARALLAGGRCLWNSGIFVGRARTFLDEARRVSPELRAPLQDLQRRGEATRFFAQAPAIALDRAVMERSGRIWTVRAEMGWDDLGTWEALWRHVPRDARGNGTVGSHVFLEAGNCLVHSPDKPVVVFGADDLVIVECDDVLLVAHRSHAERMREVPRLLEERGLGDRT